VTGGSRGIGRGVAESLLRRGAGVMIATRTAEEVTAAADELRSLGTVDGIVCDVSDATLTGGRPQRPGCPRAGTGSRAMGRSANSR
jgi:NAD(P)-dependent dehydrogenase (short-subunit alcohol dehydrogenase family)